MLTYLQMIETEEDRVKFKELYERYRGWMFHAANQILRNQDDAEDAVHEAFVTIIKNLEKIGEIDCPKTRSFIVIIVESKAIDIYRKRKRRKETVSYDELVDVIAGTEVSLPGDNGLADALVKLNPRYREVILLRHDNGYTTKEIAKIYGMTPSAVEKLLWRAKNALQRQLIDDGVMK